MRNKTITRHNYQVARLREGDQCQLRTYARHDAGDSRALVTIDGKEFTFSRQDVSTHLELFKEMLEDWQ